MQNIPSWWSKPHDTAWDHVKEALRRDWEQTKSDYSRDAGHNLGQTAGETIKQALGKAPIPSWESLEETYRWAIGARQQYGSKWDERKLESEWTTLKDGRRWEDVKPHIKRAWDYKA